MKEPSKKPAKKKAKPVKLAQPLLFDLKGKHKADAVTSWQDYRDGKREERKIEAAIAKAKKNLRALAKDLKEQVGINEMNYDILDSLDSGKGMPMSESAMKPATPVLDAAVKQAGKKKDRPRNVGEDGLPVGTKGEASTEAPAADSKAAATSAA
jgi:hypothetical protein